MSVTGFDGLDLQAGAGPKLTTAAMPLEAIGAEAVRTINPMKFNCSAVELLFVTTFTCRWSHISRRHLMAKGLQPAAGRTVHARESAPVRISDPGRHKGIKMKPQNGDVFWVVV